MVDAVLPIMLRGVDARKLLLENLLGPLTFKKTKALKESAILKREITNSRMKSKKACLLNEIDLF